MLETIRNYIIVRRWGKHKSIKEEKLYWFYRHFKLEIMENILSEFEDNTNEVCVSLNKKGLFEIIDKMNPRDTHNSHK